jgi:hypothetical protein
MFDFPMPPGRIPTPAQSASAILSVASVLGLLTAQRRSTAALSAATLGLRTTTLSATALGLRTTTLSAATLYLGATGLSAALDLDTATTPATFDLNTATTPALEFASTAMSATPAVPALAAAPA